jgi:hypothetical protein
MIESLTNKINVCTLSEGEKPLATVSSLHMILINWCSRNLNVLAVGLKPIKPKGHWDISLDD